MVPAKKSTRRDAWSWTAVGRVDVLATAALALSSSSPVPLLAEAASVAKSPIFGIGG